LVTAAEVTVPGLRPDDHKYRAGFVGVVAGSPAFPGAAALAAGAAAQSGAGYVRLVTSRKVAAALGTSLPDVVIAPVGAAEVAEDAAGLAAAAGDDRLGALVVGPGLGRSEATQAAVRELLLGSSLPAVVDADALLAFAGRPQSLRARTGLLLTPHAGELAALLGEEGAAISASHLEAVRRGAEITGNVLLLKGSSTVIAAPGGDTWVVAQGPPQLATAGTGDVLSGLLGTLLAKGSSPLEAAKAGAWLHAEAGRLGAPAHRAGVRALDLLELLPPVLSAHAPERRASWTT
jgi:NAD(P)H-hydrate epimerase